MTSGTQPRRVLYWIMCAAPPAQDWEQPARQLQEDGWDLHAIPTEAAASWLDLDSLAEITGNAVRTRPRLPHEVDELFANFAADRATREEVLGTIRLGCLGKDHGPAVPHH